jgi:hypothetical protein
MELILSQALRKATRLDIDLLKEKRLGTRTLQDKRKSKVPSRRK